MAMPSGNPLTVTKLGRLIGARIDGVRLGGDLSASMVEQIYQALLCHKVIFFRGQYHLGDEEQCDFAKLLGTPVDLQKTLREPGKHPVAEQSAHGPTGITPIDSDYGKATRWHTDFTYAANFPKAAILRAVDLPSYGGSTLWASTAAAYARLPEPLRHLTENLWALHSSNRFDQVGDIQGLGRVLIPAGSPARYDLKDKDDIPRDEHRPMRKAIETQEFRTEHPVVRVHPQTGERVLLLGQFVCTFPDLESYESKVIFELLQSRITLPENTIRWNWESGDVAIWDNCAAQHRAVDDYDNEHRLMHRVHLMGEVPVDVHGNPSRPVSGRKLEPISD